MAMYQTLRAIDTKTLLAVHNEVTGKSTTRFASRGTGEDQTLRAIRKHCNNDAGIGEIWLNEAVERAGGKPAVTLADEQEAVKGASEAVTDLINIVHKPATATVKRTRKSKGTDVLPYGGAPSACREGTKRAILVDMLHTPDGASIDEMLQAMSGGKKPWLPQTVRSGLGWDMREKGYGVKSYADDEGVERYVLVVPKDENGNEYPIPAHVPVAVKKAKA